MSGSGCGSRTETRHVISSHRKTPRKDGLKVMASSKFIPPDKEKAKWCEFQGQPAIITYIYHGKADILLLGIGRDGVVIQKRTARQGELQPFGGNGAYEGWRVNKLYEGWVRHVKEKWAKKREIPLEPLEACEG